MHFELVISWLFYVTFFWYQQIGIRVAVLSFILINNFFIDLLFSDNNL